MYKIAHDLAETMDQAHLQHTATAYHPTHRKPAIEVANPTLTLTHVIKLPRNPSAAALSHFPLSILSLCNDENAVLTQPDNPAKPRKGSEPINSKMKII